MLVWFMISRSTPKLRGSLNTISLQANSAPSLTIQETTHIPDSFYRPEVGVAETISLIGEGLTRLIGKVIERESPGPRPFNPGGPFPRALLDAPV